jgi:hypothetical protein
MYSQVLDHVLSKELAEAYREAVQAPIEKRKPLVIAAGKPSPPLLKSLKQFLM